MPLAVVCVDIVNRLLSGWPSVAYNYIRHTYNLAHIYGKVGICFLIFPIFHEKKFLPIFFCRKHGRLENPANVPIYSFRNAPLGSAGSIVKRYIEIQFRSLRDLEASSHQITFNDQMNYITQQCQLVVGKHMSQLGYTVRSQYENYCLVENASHNWGIHTGSDNVTRRETGDKIIGHTGKHARECWSLVDPPFVTRRC